LAFGRSKKNERGPGEARLCGYENTTRSKAAGWRFSSPNPEGLALSAAAVYLCETKAKKSGIDILFVIHH